jgi:hypothetical protein
MYHLKFYADCPADGAKNKFFCYPVHDGKHACDLLARFLTKGFRLRAAFLGLPGALGQSLPSSAVQFPSSIATASSMLVKYPPLSDATPPTAAELDKLVAQFPSLRDAVNNLRAAV